MADHEVPGARDKQERHGSRLAGALPGGTAPVPGGEEVTLREFVAMIALLALVWAAVIAAVVWTIRVVAG